MLTPRCDEMAGSMGVGRCRYFIRENGKWKFLVMAKKFSEFPQITTITQLRIFPGVPGKLQEIWSVFRMDFCLISTVRNQVPGHPGYLAT